MWSLLKNIGSIFISGISKYRMIIGVTAVISALSGGLLWLKSNEIKELEQEIVDIKVKNEVCLVVNNGNVEDILNLKSELDELNGILAKAKIKNRKSLKRIEEINRKKDDEIIKQKGVIEKIKSQEKINSEKSGEKDCLAMPLPNSVIKLFKQSKNS